MLRDVSSMVRNCAAFLRYWAFTCASVHPKSLAAWVVFMVVYLSVVDVRVLTIAQ